MSKNQSDCSGSLDDSYDSEVAAQHESENEREQAKDKNTKEGETHKSQQKDRMSEPNFDKIAIDSDFDNNEPKLPSDEPLDRIRTDQTRPTTVIMEKTCKSLSEEDKSNEKDKSYKSPLVSPATSDDEDSVSDSDSDKNKARNNTPKKNPYTSNKAPTSANEVGGGSLPSFAHLELEEHKSSSEERSVRT